MAAKAKCANRWCSATRHHHEGKLFRLDLDLGSTTGCDECRTEYLWLCPDCAQLMHPRVEVNGNTVTVRLSKNDTLPPTGSGAPPQRVSLN
jgi:hypothetical protein